MTSLIKSSRIIGDPIHLNRPRTPISEFADAPATEWHAPVEETDFEASVDETVSLDESSVSVEAEEPAPETSFTYEEYRARFETELAAAEEEAREKGFEQGQRDGAEQAREEHESQMTALAELIRSMRASLEQTIDGVAEVGLEVICEAVTKIVGETAVDKDVIVSIVRQVVRRAKDRSKLVVRVSRADWAILEGREAELVEGISAGSVEIVADDRVQVGGCMLETPAGNLDGRLEVQLERLHEALLQARDADREAGTAA